MPDLPPLAERIPLVLQRLAATYPEAHCELHYRNPFELLIATILSAQCTDVKVNEVTPGLFKKYPTPEKLAQASRPEIEVLIRSIGLFRAKAKNLQGCARQLMEKHLGVVPRTMAELIALPGVGRKTANVVLGNAFGINVGIVVDTHVTRLSRRLGFTRQIDPVKIEAALQPRIPVPQWTIFSHWLIWHGRRRCRAQNPDCPGCELRDLCPTGRLL
jgi:endonuclease-3